MKLNKSKGKVHPSPSSSSSSSGFLNQDPISSLNQLLPAAILTLISVLSLQDKEVLAYMITRSLNSSSTAQNPVDKSKKPNNKSSHKSPSFDCECFDCYTAYWFRWDSSPHRELIHHAIEAFEDHLAKPELPKNTPKTRRKDKHKEKMVHLCQEGKPALQNSPEILPEMASSLENLETLAHDSVEGKEEERVKEDRSHGKKQQEQLQQHKGLARKMLPDVIGFFNSRLWNLWGPNV